MVSDSSRRGGQIAGFENTANEDGSNGPGRILGGTGLSRRQLLLLVGQAGGFAAVNAVFGALTRGAAADELPMVPLEGARRVSVAILGAGIAGLCAAYELEALGFDVVLIESSSRLGGRNWTVRGGTEIREFDSSQRCGFDPGLYFNLGPARIPGHHSTVLGYCRTFAIPLEVKVNESRMAFCRDAAIRGGRPVREMQVAADIRGYIAELAAKGIAGRSAELGLNDDERERLVGLVRAFGDLGDDDRFTGSIRARRLGTGVLDAALADEPIELGELINSKLWQVPTLFTEMPDQAATMLQPVGGMDRIVAGFARTVRGPVRSRVAVERIRHSEQGVELGLIDLDSGSRSTLRADYCIDAIPFPLHRRIDHDYSAPVREAIDAMTAHRFFKVALQMGSRFWEERYGIYGGITWSDDDITQIWYPSEGFQSAKGVVLAAYCWDDEVSARWEGLSPTERLEKAVVEGERIHPEYRAEAENGISIAWAKVPNLEGCTFAWADDDIDRFCDRVRDGDGRVYFAGDQVSHLPGWQEGAMQSAMRAVSAISTRVRSGA
jgi:monoamine oxidase